MFFGSIYLLEHIRIPEYDAKGFPIKERKRLGFFSKKKNAENAMMSLKSRPRFLDYPDCFVIKRVRINTRKTNCFSKKNDTIYAVHHEYYKEDEDCDIVTQCGFFYNRNIAETCAEKLKHEKQFRDYPDGFCICDWMIDSVSELWADGFWE